MDGKFRKGTRVRFLIGLLIVLVGIAVVLFCKARAPQSSSATEESALSGKDTAEKPPTLVLRSLLAGSWYSADPEVLTKQFDGFFQKADPKTIDNVIALILPHAGYTWSGRTAAFGLKATPRQYKRIVVIGPSHRVYMDQMFSVPRAAHYQTPLGRIPL
ncbi:MAG: AmmeMemoRadiSam system protein B, partial [Planctomycetota bacterium]